MLRGKAQGYLILEELRSVGGTELPSSEARAPEPRGIEPGSR